MADHELVAYVDALRRAGVTPDVLARAAAPLVDPEHPPPDAGLAPRRGLIVRARDAIRGAATGWFSPGAPITPMAPPGTSPRQFDYPIGYNIGITPRAQEAISFRDLRALSRSCDILRLAIETSKDQMAGVHWEIKVREGHTDGGGVDEITEFLLRPDRQYPWKTWLRMLLEDVLVIDAPALYVRRTVSGEVFALEPIDGATIRPLLDDSGRRPIEGPAYQQIIKGLPSQEFTADELIYVPRNPATDRIYGLCYSPDTEVLTRRGWLPVDAVTLADEVATREMGSGLFEWQRPTHLTGRQVNGHLLRFHSRSLDLLVTPEHRMLVTTLPRSLGGRRGRKGEVLVPAADLARHSTREVKIPVTSIWRGIPIEAKEFRAITPSVQAERLAALAHLGGRARSVVAGSTGAEKAVRMSGDDYCALMGAYIAEGNIRAAGGIEIAQRSTSQGYAAFSQLVARVLNGPAQHNGRAFVLPRRGLTEHFRALGHAHEKYVPDEIMNATATQIRRFLDYYLLGDGHQEPRVNHSGRGRRGGGAWRATTVSSRLADQLVELAQKVGLSASVRRRRGGRSTIVGQACTTRDSYVVSFRHSRAMSFTASPVAYCGPTYCLTVPNGVVYVRRNGKPAWCSNSPVEQVVLTVNIALKRAIFQLDYYTEGNLPDAIIKCPDSWTPKQIADFAKQWQTLFEGDPLAERRKVRFAPGGDIHETKQAPLKDDFDEWLARVISYTFSLPPTWAVKMMNRGTAQIAQDTATEEGQLSRMGWWADVMNYEVLWRIFGRPDLEFAWQDIRPPDPKVQAETAEIYVRMGIKSVDEVRQEVGLEAIGQSNALMTATGPVLLGEAGVEEQARKDQIALEIAQRTPAPPAAPNGGTPPRQLTDQRNETDTGTPTGKGLRPPPLRKRRYISDLSGVKKKSSPAAPVIAAGRRPPSASSPC